MKNKIVFGAIFTIILLMLVPSISAVEYRTAVDENTFQLINELEELGNSRYIDIKLILIVVMNILTTVFYGTPSFRRAILSILGITVILQEFFYGENLMENCANVDFGFILTVFLLIGSIVWRMCPIKSLAIILVLIIRVVGQCVAFQFWMMKLNEQ